MKQRKIILSRKGFDSEYGGIPSPILPDGTMLSLPIPSKGENNKFENLFHNGISYAELIKELGYKQEIEECHLDPDLRYDAIVRSSNWRACFGQSGAAASHLLSNDVGVGDIFLFFGWCRLTEYDSNGKLRYVRGASDIHAIYGYLQVGEIAATKEEREKFQWHPHCNDVNYNNFIFTSGDSLLNGRYPGAGVFKFNERVQLTKEGMTRSKWELPNCLRDVQMTYHSSKSYKEDYFQSAMIGQEFVLNSNYEIEQWILSLFQEN
jgi:hypothetical protein